MNSTNVRTIGIAAMMAASCLAGAEGEDSPARLRLSSELELPIQSVRGPGASQSSLTRGHRFMHSLGLSGTGKAQEIDWFADIRLRATDDPRQNPQKASLDGLKLQIRQGRAQFSAGDVFESFSQYSLSTALKGAAVKIGDDEKAGTSFQAVWGNADPRWNVFSPGNAGPYIHRTVVGGRVAHRIGETAGIGLSYVRATDSGRTSATDPLYENDLYSLTGDVVLPNAWQLDGEFTWSKTSESPSAGAADLNYNGRGIRLQTAGRLGKGKMNLQYENVQPRFYTGVGSATSDRERVRARYGLKLNPRTQMSVGLIWYRNNLQGQLTDTTKALRPEFGLSFTEVGGREEATLDLNLSHDNRLRGTDRVDDTSIEANYHDRLGAWDTDWSLGLARYYTRGSQNSREITFGTAWFSRLRRGAWVYRPSINLGTWTASDSFNSSNDASYEIGVGLGLERPASGLSCSLKTGLRRAIVDRGDSNTRLFADAMLNYRPQAWREFGGGLFLKLGWNDFKYSNGGRNFQEVRFGLGFVFEY